MQAQKLIVSIVKAAGLDEQGLAAGDLWCVCEIQRHDPQQASCCRCETRRLRSSVNPVWNEVHSLGPWFPGDDLHFTMYRESTTGSISESRMLLPSASFYPGGYEGELASLADSSLAGSPSLHVRIVAPAARVPAVPPPPRAPTASTDCSLRRPSGGASSTSKAAEEDGTSLATLLPPAEPPPVPLPTKVALVSELAAGPAQPLRSEPSSLLDSFTAGDVDEDLLLVSQIGGLRGKTARAQATVSKLTAAIAECHDRREQEAERQRLGRERWLAAMKLRMVKLPTSACLEAWRQHAFKEAVARRKQQEADLVKAAAQGGRLELFRHRLRRARLDANTASGTLTSCRVFMAWRCRASMAASKQQARSRLRQSASACLDLRMAAQSDGRSLRLAFASWCRAAGGGVSARSAAFLREGLCLGLVPSLRQWRQRKGGSVIAVLDSDAYRDWLEVLVLRWRCLASDKGRQQLQAQAKAAANHAELLRGAWHQWLLSNLSTRCERRLMAEAQAAAQECRAMQERLDSGLLEQESLRRRFSLLQSRGAPAAQYGQRLGDIQAKLQFLTHFDAWRSYAQRRCWQRREALRCLGYSARSAACTWGANVFLQWKAVVLQSRKVGDHLVGSCARLLAESCAATMLRCCCLGWRTEVCRRLGEVEASARIEGERQRFETVTRNALATQRRALRVAFSAVIDHEDARRAATIFMAWHGHAWRVARQHVESQRRAAVAARDARDGRVSAFLELTRHRLDQERVALTWQLWRQRVVLQGLARWRDKAEVDVKTRQSQLDEELAYCSRVLSVKSKNLVESRIRAVDRLYLRYGFAGLALEARSELAIRKVHMAEQGLVGLYETERGLLALQRERFAVRWQNHRQSDAERVMASEVLRSWRCRCEERVRSRREAQRLCTFEGILGWLWNRSEEAALLRGSAVAMQPIHACLSSWRAYAAGQWLHGAKHRQHGAVSSVLYAQLQMTTKQSCWDAWCRLCTEAAGERRARVLQARCEELEEMVACERQEKKRLSNALLGRSGGQSSSLRLRHEEMRSRSLELSRQLGEQLGHLDNTGGQLQSSLLTVSESGFEPSDQNSAEYYRICSGAASSRGDEPDSLRDSGVFISKFSWPRHTPPEPSDELEGAHDGGVVHERASSFSASSSQRHRERPAADMWDWSDASAPLCGGLDDTPHEAMMACHLEHGDLEAESLGTRWQDSSHHYLGPRVAECPEVGIETQASSQWEDFDFSMPLCDSPLSQSAREVVSHSLPQAMYQPLGSLGSSSFVMTSAAMSSEAKKGRRRVSFEEGKPEVKALDDGQYAMEAETSFSSGGGGGEVIAMDSSLLSADYRGRPVPRLGSWFSQEQQPAPHRPAVRGQAVPAVPPLALPVNSHSAARWVATAPSGNQAQAPTSKAHPLEEGQEHAGSSTSLGLGSGGQSPELTGRERSARNEDAAEAAPGSARRIDRVAGDWPQASWPPQFCGDQQTEAAQPSGSYLSGDASECSDKDEVRAALARLRSLTEEAPKV
eukprot:TRINITY_DN23041_c0_g1_i1.p1 TRINITY_DN23041_c0_g1~~TRINITY_DN23041_c0_g1_i1.p1  ORF type:complete len:1509 (-),score=339.49 TRINITY_DN23041_c0_g1_i1:311-4837(-)